MLNTLKQRYATQIFETSSTLRHIDIEEIIEAFKIAPSSFNLQPTRLMIIPQHEICDQLIASCYNQKKISTCSHLLVFCTTNISVEHYTSMLMKNGHYKSQDEHLQYVKNVSTHFSSMSYDEIRELYIRQVYLSVGHLLPYLINKDIDSCVMEGFNKKDLCNVLNLQIHNVEPVLLVPIGYRSMNDKTQFFDKQRLSNDELVISNC